MRFLALALSLFACGPSSTYHGATSYTPAERASIEKAAATMSERTGGQIYTIVWDDGDDGDNRILREEPPTPDARGQFFISREAEERSIYLEPSLTGDALRIVAMHEFGHSYGLDHHDGPGLMNASSGADVWNAADVAACRRDGMCK